MPGEQSSLSVPDKDKVLWTNAARCRDCNRCVGVCPVKAICKEVGQAKIISEKCILCGACIRECPQGAKEYRHDIEKAAALIKNKSMVIASLAPSFLSVFTPAERRGLPAVLRQLGFSAVTETALGAELIARESRAIIDSDSAVRHICSACPAVVSYIQKYRLEAIEALIKVVSPMIAHGRYLKKKYGAKTGVIFIGPCLAKKEEAALQDEGQSIDVVLTFQELYQWIEQKNLHLALSEDSDFDEKAPFPAKTFPLTGGFALTAGFPSDFLDRLVLAADGSADVKEAVDYLIQSDKPVLLEPLMCPGGCLGGAGMPSDKTAGKFKLKQNFLHALADYRDSWRGKEPLLAEGAVPDLAVDHLKHSVKSAELPVDEFRIHQVLARFGKADPADELNCGSCGYSTCRDKAQAVLAGMAEIDMCLPYMRQRAELKSDAIVHNSPNAIIALDTDLKIIQVNAAFCEMFVTSEHCQGKHISYFIHPEPFQRVLQEKVKIFNETVHHSAYGIICQQLIYTIGSEDLKQVIGVMVNMTQSKKQALELDALRKEAIGRAGEVVDRQIKSIQDITKALGKSAAETSAIMSHLTELVRGKGKS